MPTFFAKQFVGVADGTKIPADRADGRQAGATKGVTVGSKDNTNILAIADKLYIGKLRAGELLTGIHAITDTSLGTTTVSIGTLATPAKYVNALTLTALNAPVALGPLASAIDAGPVSADEDLYATFAVAAVPAVVRTVFLLERTAIH